MPAATAGAVGTEARSYAGWIGEIGVEQGAEGSIAVKPLQARKIRGQH